MTAAADALMGIFGFKRVESEMKTDRELLELAAKAAGVVGVWNERGQCVHVTDCAGMSDMWWRPLEDDGDAMRLAVNLSLCVFVNGMFVHADCKHCAGGDIGYFEENSARNGGCIMTATRRAIVRAAAAIGESIK